MLVTSAMGSRLDDALGDAPLRTIAPPVTPAAYTAEGMQAYSSTASVCRDEIPQPSGSVMLRASSSFSSSPSGSTTLSSATWRTVLPLAYASLAIAAALS